jgi:hypothetical protein
MLELYRERETLANGFVWYSPEGGVSATGITGCSQWAALSLTAPKPGRSVKK